MSLKATITEHMKDAMRAKDSARLGTIRMLLAEIKKEEIDSRQDVSDEGVITIVHKMIKQRKDSITQYDNAQRLDLAEIEKAEIVVLTTYMPQPLSAADIDAIIAQALADTGASGAAGMGKVMAVVKPKLAGRADMTAVSAQIKALLAIR